MTARERVLALRLLKKQNRNPKIAKDLGIEIKMVSKQTINEVKNNA